MRSNQCVNHQADFDSDADTDTDLELPESVFESFLTDVSTAIALIP